MARDPTRIWKTYSNEGWAPVEARRSDKTFMHQKGGLAAFGAGEAALLTTMARGNVSLVTVALNCAGAGGAPPATLAEFTLNSPVDFYDVSLVDGYNMKMSIVPYGGSGKCAAVWCVTGVNQKCPTQLRVKSDEGQVVACRSACMAFNKPKYCCTGAYNNPKTCKPTYYATLFKASCPKAYSYAYDDSTSTFTCKNAHYLISSYEDVQQRYLLGSATGSCPGTTMLVPLRSDELPPHSASSLAMRDFLLIIR
ncbi:LOW QUALITY PROTEIN: Thaumatin family [Dillenia turbinata]|uniref:Thaumatin family n=1 Tax=Dillenia turbinata TaxID=194707 RepID=A0AAN8Z8C2_9MAGN